MRRHAPGAVASVSLSYGPRGLRLTVENDVGAHNGAASHGAAVGRAAAAARETGARDMGVREAVGTCAATAYHDGNGSGDSARPGVGILGMRERATALGGTLQAGPCDGAFRVVAELPYRRST